MSSPDGKARLLASGISGSDPSQGEGIASDRFPSTMQIHRFHFLISQSMRTTITYGFCGISEPPELTATLRLILRVADATS